ncbi:MAG: carbohydrate ABC transporter permease [Candidatus Cloacimonetes bacterium]|nr:carbohydrate ABC transporter permease [Candidatus Cloacimonadota bacterium]
MKKRHLIVRIVECILLCTLFIIYVFPFYWMLISSLKTTFEAISVTPVWWPNKLMWHNYVDAWNQANFLKYGMNSIIISFGAVILCLASSVPCAYAFARMEFRLKKPLFAIVLSDMLIPIQCTFLPIFIMYSKLGWLNTYRALLILFIYSGFTIFFLRNAFMQVNNEVLEAARLDGASELSVMFRVIFPMVKPVIITMALLIFLMRWNDYFWNLALTTNDAVRTLPQAVNAITKVKDGFVTRWELAMAGSTMLMAPMLILYIFANKKIKNAFVYSGIK